MPNLTLPELAELRKSFGERLVWPVDVLFEMATQAATELDRYRRFAPRCHQCGKGVEPERFVYAVPTCFACLPPPEPIPVVTIEQAGGLTDG